MISSLTRFARAAGAYVPEATAMSILMLAGLVLIALALGNDVTTISDAFYRGLWMLLPFSMQMALMLLLSAVLSMTPVFRKVVSALAQLPRSALQVLALASFLTAALSYCYWALGLALGPLIALNFAGAAEKRGIRVDFPCLLATVCAAQSVWQFGLSSSAALLVASPGHFLEATTGIMPMNSTILSRGAVLLSVSFPVILVLLARWIMPKNAEPLSAFPRALALLDTIDTPEASATNSGIQISGFAAWCDRTRLLPLLLSLALVSWLYHHFVVKGAALDFNAMLTALLLLAVLLQGSLGKLLHALSKSIASCWQIMVLYQLYGAVAGLLQYTNTGDVFASYFAKLATPQTFTLLTALAGTLVAIFVPSSGGQWVIQGFITTKAAAVVGATPQQGLLALGIGDQMGNLISPFWIVIAASIAGIDFRKIFGYMLIFSLPWFLLGVVIFTWLPAR